MSFAAPEFDRPSDPSPPARVLIGRASHFFFGQKRLSGAIARMAVAEFLTIATMGLVIATAHGAVAHLDAGSLFQLYLPIVLGLAAIDQVLVFSSGQYDRLHAQSKEFFCLSGLGALLVAFSLLVTALYLVGHAPGLDRTCLLLQFAGIAVMTVAVRAIYHSQLQEMVRSGAIETRRAIVIGHVDHCRSISTRLQAEGIRTIGSFAIPKEISDDAANMDAFVSGLCKSCRRLAADEIIIVDDDASTRLVDAIATALSELPVNVQVLPTGLVALLSRSTIVKCGDLLALRLHERPLSILDRGIKRAFDVIAASAGFLMLSPLLVLVAAAIKLDSRGPILFAQKRHGYNNVPIRVFKFRTMTVMEDGNDFRQATKNDKRVTRVGRILRQTSIDELPQLYNVLIGEMSVVGPRPHAIAHNEMFDGLIASFWKRHNVKPGITGWAQVNGSRGETETLEKMQRRIEYDLLYIDRWSFWLDMKIIALTLFSRTSHENAH
jgi:Undecaprenyl-phosphate glucose phosphotransferase